MTSLNDINCIYDNNYESEASSGSGVSFGHYNNNNNNNDFIVINVHVKTIRTYASHNLTYPQPPHN